MARVDLHADGFGGRVAVPLRHLPVSALGDGFHVRLQQVGLGLVQDESKVRRLDGAVVGKGVEQVEGVLEPEVEGVARERLLQVLPAGIDSAQTDLVESHETPRSPALGVGFGGLAGEGEGILVLAVVSAQLRENEQRGGGYGGDRADRLHDGAEALVVTVEVEDRGPGAERLQIGGVHLQGALSFLQRQDRVPLEEPQPREEGPGANQIGVGRESALDRDPGIAAAFQTGDPGKTQPGNRVRRVLVQDVLESGRRLASVVSLQEKFGDGELCGMVQGPGCDGLVQGPESVVRVFVVPARQVDQRPPHRREFGGREVARVVVVVDEAVEEVACDLAIAVAVFEDSQFDAGEGSRGAGFLGPRRERGPGLVDPPHLHERGPHQRPRARNPPLHPPFGRLYRAFVVTGLAQRGDPPGQRGGVRVEGLRPQGSHGLVVAAGTQGFEAGCFLGGGSAATERCDRQHQQDGRCAQPARAAGPIRVWDE